MTTTNITGEIYGEERDAPRAYLTAQSQKPFAELRAPYEASHAALQTALAGVTESQARFTPASGEGEDAWGIAQIVRHLGSEARFATRVRNLALGDEMGAPAPQPGGDDPRSIDELRAAMEESGQAMRDAIRSLNGEENLEKAWTHPWFGELNCRGMVALQTLHSNDHARQIERIKALPGYPAS